MNCLSPISLPCEDQLYNQEPIQKIFVGGLSTTTSSSKSKLKLK